MACADRPPRRHCSVVIRPCCRARRSSTERCCDERGVGTSSAPATDGCIGVRSPNGGQRRGRRPQARRTAVSPAGVVHRPAPRSSPHGSIFWLQKALIDCPFCPVASRSQPRQLQPGDQQRLALVSRGLVAGEQRTDPGRRCGRRGAPAPGAGHRVVMRVRRRHGTSSAGSPGPGRPRRPPPRPPGAKGRSVSCSVCSSCGRNAAGRQCRATVNRNRDEAALYQVPSSWSTKACTDATCGWSIAAQSVWGATCTAGMPAARAPLTSKCTESPR